MENTSRVVTLEKYIYADKSDSRLRWSDCFIEHVRNETPWGVIITLINT